MGAGCSSHLRSFQGWGPLCYEVSLANVEEVMASELHMQTAWLLNVAPKHCYSDLARALPSCWRQFLLEAWPQLRLGQRCTARLVRLWLQLRREQQSQQSAHEARPCGFRALPKFSSGCGTHPGLEADNVPPRERGGVQFRSRQRLRGNDARSNFVPRTQSAGDGLGFPQRYVAHETIPELGLMFASSTSGPWYSPRVLQSLSM